MKLTTLGRWAVGYNELAAPKPLFATTTFSITTMPCKCKRWWAWKFYLERRCSPVSAGAEPK